MSVELGLFSRQFSRMTESVVQKKEEMKDSERLATVGVIRSLG